MHIFFTVLFNLLTLHRINMNGFSVCNKVSGLYRSSDNINNFTFIVKCKEVNKIIPLPNFEAFALQDNNVEKDFNEHYEEKKLCWQEKRLSSREIYLYKDSNNCKTDAQKKYHDLIEEKELKSTIHSPKIFTYVEEDNYEYDNRLTTEFHNLQYLRSKLNKLQVNDDIVDNSIMFKDTAKPSEGTGINEQKESHIIKMYILLDMNNSESDPTFMLKREHVLFEMTWDSIENCLVISPDLNDLFINPYILETNYYSKQVFHYSIEQDVPDFPDDAKLAEIQLLEKFDESQRSMHNSKIFKNFIIPPKNILMCLFVIEIISARVPDYLSGLYVEYTVEMPFGFITSDPLKGVTQIAKPKNKDNVTHFGHVFELCFHYQMGITLDNTDLPQEPEIYFEIISCDSWGRHRTEGYCYSKLPVTQPGPHKATLKCFRLRGENERLWEMNRYFIGGRHMLEDLTWLSTLSMIEGNKINKFGVKTVSSGTLDLSTNVILQSRNFISKNEEIGGSEGSELFHKESVAERLTADSLFKSVNTVLQAYKHAKDKLISTQEGHT